MSNMEDPDVTRLLSAAEPFETVLYLGPGLTETALAVSEGHAERLVAFVDAKTHRLLDAQAPKRSLETTTHPAIVSPSGAEAELHGYNMPGFASVRAATGLRELFPGLRDLPRTPIETRPLHIALQEADLAGDNNMLILGASGCEADILRALADTEGAPLFSRIILPLPSLPLYEKSADGAALTALLEAACYRQTGTDMSDPDLPLAMFDLDRARFADRAALSDQAAEIATLTGKLERLTSDLQEARAERDTAQSALATAKTDAERQTTALQTLKEQHSALQANVQTLQETTEAEKTAARALEAELTARTSEATQAQQELTDAKTRIATLDAEQKRLSDQCAQYEAAISSRQKSISDLSGKLDARNAEITELQRKLGHVTADLEAQKAATHERAEKLKALEGIHAELNAVHDKNKVLTDTLQSQKAKADQLEQQIEALKAGHSTALAKASDDLKTSRHAKEKSEADLAIALRMQALREADLADLRTQYQSLKQENDHLSALLGKVYHALDFLQSRKRSSQKASKRP